MIVPRSIVGWLLVLLVWSAAAPLSPALSSCFVAFIGILAVLSAIDIALAFEIASNVTLSLPSATRLGLHRPGTLECHIHNRSGRAFTMTVVSVLPAELGVENDERLVAVPVGEHSAVTYACTPARRGVFRIGPCHAEIVSPLGLWAVRKQYDCAADARVFPDLWRARRKVTTLFPRRLAPGSHLQRAPGQGREFDKLRDYVRGDSRDIISWKATAKRARPISKVYQVERTQEVYVVIDASRLSGRLAGGEPVLEHYLSAALTLGLAVQHQGDLFGLLTFDDQVRTFIRAGGGTAHYSACRDALLNLRDEWALERRPGGPGR